MFWQFKYVIENVSRLKAPHFFGVALFNMFLANFNAGY